MSLARHAKRLPALRFHPGAPVYDFVSPRPTLRRSRHPDCRAHEVSVVDGAWTVSSIEPYGERRSFSRGATTGWETESYVAAQLRDGFVDVE